MLGGEKMEYEPKFQQERNINPTYELRAVTKDSELWRNKKPESYKIQEMALLCCCVHLY